MTLERLARQFDSITGRSPTSTPSQGTWARAVRWLLGCLPRILVRYSDQFWSRLDQGERMRLRGFADALVRNPARAVTDTQAGERRDVVRIVRKGLGLRP